MSSSAFWLEGDSKVPGLAPFKSGALQSALRGDDDDDDDDEYTAWETASRLSLSFAPDGTSISAYQSSLYASFGHLLSAQELEGTILQAFQSWAQHSSVNVGLVSDSGAEFGIGGATQGDHRFGDIRVGAVPMAGDVFAVAVPHNDFMSGSWAGDILFNSNADFVDANQFYAVALHEAGHVLGLEHTIDETSVMHPTAWNQSLSSNDILDLKALYGDRVLDQYDEDDDGNTMNDAVEIRNNGTINGRIPLVAFGDISDSSDVDYFEFEPNSNQEGSITFRLRSDTVSLLQPKITVLNEQGGEIGSVIATSNRGDNIAFQIDNVDEDQKYFVRIESIGNEENRFGSYALITTIDDNVMQGLDLIDTAIRRNYGFLEQDDIQDLFLTGLNAPISNDLHTNDTVGTATILETENNDYRLQASIADSIDVDYYQVEAFDSTMSIRVNALAESFGLISDVEVFDASLQPITGQVLVNGNGELLVDYQGIEEGDNYFVSIKADRPGRQFDVGNYDLNISFSNTSRTLQTLGVGQLSNRNRTEEHTLYVARTQLFHFALSGLNESFVPEATIWMSIYDDQGVPKYRVATRPDETRTSKSVILRPGSYSIHVNVTFPDPPRVDVAVPFPLDRKDSKSSIPQLNYRIDGIGISDPTGPEAIDPSKDPFAPCDKNTSEFCYPNGIHTTDPFIVVDDDAVPLPPTTRDPRWMDANAWYWQPDWLG